MLGNFSDPACNLFIKKIVNGQVCYEADVNQYKKITNWKEALQKGFSFIVDTNDEYDVKNLIERTASERNEKRKINSAYKQAKKNNYFSILLQTISK